MPKKTTGVSPWMEGFQLERITARELDERSSQQQLVEYHVREGVDIFYDGKTIVDIWHFLNGRQVGSHIRNDAAGNLVYKQDWGYPTYYVEFLMRIIYGLIAVIVSLAGYIFLRNTRLEDEPISLQA